MDWFAPLFILGLDKTNGGGRGRDFHQENSHVVSWKNIYIFLAAFDFFKGLLA
jgi:hypothetical protein